MKFLFVILSFVVFSTSAAEARHRHHGYAHARHYAHHVHHYAHVHHHYRHYARHYAAPRQNFAAFGPTFQSSTPASRSFGEAISRPARAIYGHLVCALNVNSALAERGIRGTGSAAAMSFLHWGRSAGGPVPGAVIVSGRRGGGHVAIVSRVVNGQVYAWNASERSGWREIPYRLRVIDYRVPG